MRAGGSAVEVEKRRFICLEMTGETSEDHGGRVAGR
jgi:hypothetical protein